MNKVPAIMTVAQKGSEFVRQIAPRQGDILLPKSTAHSSAQVAA